MDTFTDHLDDIWRQVLDRSAGLAHSIHGPDHWRRVERNGLYLAEQTVASPVVVSLFAVFHDSMRENEGIDPGHGRRGAELARSMADELSFVDDEDLERLLYACEWHTDRTHHDDPTIGACWDADRLDLGRVGITPKPGYLNTEPARSIALAGDLAPLDAVDLRATGGSG